METREHWCDRHTAGCFGADSTRRRLVPQRRRSAGARTLERHAATVVNHFAGAGIEAMVFDDGTSWNAADITAHVINELTEGNDNYTGTANADLIESKGGNDTVRGGGGNDVIDGGLGDDSMLGEGGDSIHCSAAQAPTPSGVATATTRSPMVKSCSARPVTTPTRSRVGKRAPYPTLVPRARARMCWCCQCPPRTFGFCAGTTRQREGYDDLVLRAAGQTGDVVVQFFFGAIANVTRATRSSPFDSPTALPGRSPTSLRGTSVRKRPKAVTLVYRLSSGGMSSMARAATTASTASKATTRSPAGLVTTPSMAPKATTVCPGALEPTRSMGTAATPCRPAMATTPWRAALAPTPCVWRWGQRHLSVRARFGHRSGPGSGWSGSHPVGLRHCAGQRHPAAQRQ